MKKIVVLTGAGISAESGIKTFRDSDGLWENHRVDDVATPEGFLRNPQLVLDFYNFRRTELEQKMPNSGHIALAKFENLANVQIITQNIDDLHERAGSSKILHLHGEITKARSSENAELVVDIGYQNINIGDKSSDGSQLRPHIVWFGEAVPAIETASKMCGRADIFIIVGTSLKVYPAASLLDYIGKNVPIYLIDPHPVITKMPNLIVIQETAGIGVDKCIADIQERNLL